MISYNMKFIFIYCWSERITSQCPIILGEQELWQRFHWVEPTALWQLHYMLQPVYFISLRCPIE